MMKIIKELELSDRIVSTPPLLTFSITHSGSKVEGTFPIDNKRKLDDFIEFLRAVKTSNSDSLENYNSLIRHSSFNMKDNIIFDILNLSYFNIDERDGLSLSVIIGWFNINFYTNDNDPINEKQIDDVIYIVKEEYKDYIMSGNTIVRMEDSSNNSYYFKINLHLGYFREVKVENDKILQLSMVVKKDKEDFNFNDIVFITTVDPTRVKENLTYNNVSFEDKRYLGNAKNGEVYSLEFLID